MFKIGNLELQSRLLLGTGKFENEEVQSKAITPIKKNPIAKYQRTLLRFSFIFVSYFHLYYVVSYYDVVMFQKSPLVTVLTSIFKTTVKL